jgi:PD-(D/E)XK nuclease superfamily
MKPNLFQFASSELSQDAILCWLAAWADPRAADQDILLHRLGQAFLQAAFAKHGRKVPPIEKPIEIRRQHKGIDVLLVINDTIAVCIEDKVGTNEHSDQLQRYIAGLKDDGFAEDRIVPVYVQTGDQGSYRAVRASGYAVMRRSELVALLHEYLEQGGSDSVALSFHDHLADIDRRVAAFCDQPLAEWDWFAWQGFYSTVQQVLGEGEWSYVANPSGGFLGYWWHSHSDPESDQYLQLEQNRMCFRITVDDPAKRSDLRSRWQTRILDAARQRNFSVATPKRLGSGQTMAVAVVNGEYRAVKINGLLDFDATIAVLRTAAEVLDSAIAAANSAVAVGKGH